MSQDKKVKANITEKEKGAGLELKLVTKDKEQDSCLLPCIPMRA